MEPDVELGAHVAVQKERDAMMAFGATIAKASLASDKAKVAEQWLYSAHKERVQKEWATHLALYNKPV